MSKIGVLLSGCGNKDGSEIHEATLTLLTLDQNDAEAVCMAPNIDQHHVINHLTGEEVVEKRNVLVESARIARGSISDIQDISAKDLDALIIPGGLGAIKNLSDFAFKGEKAQVNNDVQRLITELSEAGKPIGAICIAPATLTKAMSAKKPKVTIGHEASVASTIESMGGEHTNCSVDMIQVDIDNKLVSTPAYMLGPGIKDIHKGIEKLVLEVLRQVS